jgi:hypothetical protein
VPTTNTSASSENSDIPDKAALYGIFQRNADWRETLGKKAAYKALDIADDEMYINAPKTENHYHEKPASLASKALPLALAAALGAGGAMLPALWNSRPEVTDTDTNTQYRIEALPGE